jgi:hypothetical protein
MELFRTAGFFAAPEGNVLQARLPATPALRCANGGR